jgi:CRP-like cAMP-binding protein
MNEENLLGILRDIRFLRGIDDEHLKQLAELGKFVEFPEGKIIFRECEPASCCFLIVDGSVSLEICGPGVGCRRILTVGEGELLGWSAVLEQPLLTATARTLTATRVIELSGRQVSTLCEFDPEFAYEFMRRTALTLVHRLTATRKQLLEKYGASMPTVDESD